MSKYGVSLDQIRSIIEKVRQQQKQRPTIFAGEDTELIIIDAQERKNDVLVAAFEKGSDEIKVFVVSKIQVPSEVIERIIKMLQEMKNVKVRARVLGSRILDIEDVQEFGGRIGWVKPEVGVAERSKSGARLWLYTGEDRYLVSDMSIKGMLLCGAASDGTVVAFIARKNKTSTGIPLIQFIDWEIVKVPEAEERASSEEAAESGESTEEVTEEEIDAELLRQAEEIAREEV